MATALPLEGQSPPAESKPATFGTASFVFAILTIVLPVLVMIFFGQKATQEGQAANNNADHGALVSLLLVLAGVVFAGIVSGLSSLVGTLTGVVALIRGESHAWRPVVGLIVNVPVFALFAYTVIAVRMSSG